MRNRLPARLRPGSLIAVAAGAAVAASLLAAPPALATPAAPAARAHAPRPQRDPVVPGHLARPAAHRRHGRRVPEFRPPAPVWPAATTATVRLPVPRPAARRAPLPYPGGWRLRASVAPPEPARVRAGSSPVWLRSATGGQARVRVFGHAAAATAGVDGVLMRLARVAGGAAPGRVEVGLDYARFRYAYGGDWAYRLRLVELARCTSTAPVPRGCTLVPLRYRNDVRASRLGASVEVGPGAVFLAAMSSPSGSAGSFAATSLSMSSTWSAGGSSGDFQWSYPLHTPPALGGPAPALSLTYDSAVVDGQMATSNNQPSSIGEGFDLTTGYIERTYTPCAQDMGGSANNTTATGDLCWGPQLSATLVLAGHSGELIADASDPNRWHLRDDDGTYVRYLTGASNGTHDGGYWVVTTTSGVQYWFGKDASGNNSAWTEPVYGNNPGEPCHQSSFAASSCSQAWRWNLDHVVDPSGNTMDYYYSAETNEYAADDNATSPVSYVRGGVLTKITYGTRTGSTGNPPMQVTFGYGPRCVTSSCGTHDGTNWPDTPWDMQCTGSPCYIGGPTYWNTDALTQIQTQLYSGTGTTYDPVTTWALTHTMPDPGDGTDAGLWLSGITQTGNDGSPAVTLPPVTFTPLQLANRVDTLGGTLPPMNWMRMSTITTESGAQIQVSYDPSTCVAGQTEPNQDDLQDNTLTCYPVSWTPPGDSGPITDFFNKYTVARVDVADLTTPGNPTTVTTYKYLGNPAWHYTDTTGIVQASQRTWSVWRGYPQVETDTGTGADEQSAVTTYFQGMNGDHLPSGTRSVTLPAIDMDEDGSTTGPQDAPAVPDDDAFAGMTRETVTYDGPGGAEVRAVAYNPWESSPTASVTVNGVTVNARFTGIQDTYTRTDLDGGRAPLVTSTSTVFDSMGEPVQNQQNVPGASRCTLTSYARNMASDGSTWLVSFPYRVQVFATDCATAQAGSLSASQVISDTLTYYDGAATASAPPTRGLVTRTDVLRDWVSSAPVYLTSDTKSYDADGRVTSETDVRGNTTTTVYTENAGGQLVTTTSTNALGWVTAMTVDPATGQALQITDQNGRVTTDAYDALGRLLSVWEPGRDAGSQSPNISYSYLIRDNAPSVVTTSTLTPSGGYRTSYQLYDGMLRPVQTQAPRGDGTPGALVTDTFYDSAGNAYQSNSPYLAAITPGTSYFVANEQNVPQRTVTTFDGAGRTAQQVVYDLNSQGASVPFATTSWAYGGDRVDVTPPAGGVATSTVTDPWGNTVAVRQYHGATPTPFTAGSYDQTSYTYDNKNQLVTVTDPAGNQWTTAYDVMGRPVSTTDPDSGTTTKTYDTAGDVTSVTDARGVTLNLTYDSLGRETGVYDGAVNSADQLDGWTYDGLANSRGYLTKWTSYDNGNAYSMTVNGFTATYQPTSVTYTIPAAETGLAGSYTYVYTYDADGSLATTRLPAAGNLGQETLTDQYTSLGQPSGLNTSLPSSTSLVQSVAYTGYGEPGVITLATGGGSAVYEAYTYDQSNRRLTEQAVTKQTSPTAVSDVRYAYDPSGNILSADDTVSGDDQCFGYDYAGRLTSAWTPAGGNCAAAKSVPALGGPAPYWDDWTFNAAGTRTTQVAHDTANGVATTSYVTPAAGAAQPHTVTSASTTDGTGTRTASYGYDAGGYLTSRPSPNGPASQTLTYGPQGYLAKVSDNGSVTSYTYDVNGNTLIERDSAGGTLYLPGEELRYTASTGAKAGTRYYTLFGQVVAMRTASGVTWMAADRQDTVNITIASSTQAVAERWLDPYGNQRGGTSGSWPAADTRGYVNGTPSPDGLTTLGARQYDPVLGRFTSVDPVRPTGQPQLFDPYAYCGDNPVGAADPSGTTPDGNPAPEPPDHWPGSWWTLWSSGWYSYDSDGYHYQELDRIFVSCEGIFLLPSFQCWGAIWDAGSDSWLDQNGKPTDHRDRNDPLQRWVTGYEEYNDPGAFWYATPIWTNLIRTPLGPGQPPPPVDGPVATQPPAVQNPSQPSSPVSPLCGTVLGFLCTAGSAINAAANWAGGWENVAKWTVSIGSALVCGAAIFTTLACIAGSVAFATGFGAIDFARAGGFSGSPTQVRDNIVAGLLNEVFALAVASIPGDPATSNLAGFMLSNPAAPSLLPSYGRPNPALDDNCLFTPLGPGLLSRGC